MSSDSSSIPSLYEKLSAGDRKSLARAITLVESQLPADMSRKNELLERCGRSEPDALRIGISGLPGAGKSTLIERLGLTLVRGGRRVAVLAIDPSSERSGGSIMGDKTRMGNLALEPNAFIRPSPTSGVLGGVAEMTRETMMVCEAAGFDVIIVETVGVGQAETIVHSMVDFLLLVTISGAGDMLQGIKRGIMELADGIAVNKADGKNKESAARTAAELRQAVDLVAEAPGSEIPVNTVSAATGDGVLEMWEAVLHVIDERRESGAFEGRRRRQVTDWFEQAVQVRLRLKLEASEELAALRADLRRRIENGTVHPYAGANKLVDTFLGAEDD